MTPGHSLKELEPAAVDDATPRRRLGGGGPPPPGRHRPRRPGRHSVLVDEDRRPWLVDFDHATAVAPERLRQADLVELLVSLAVRFGPDRTLAGAVDAFGPEPLAAALAATTPPPSPT